jgi:molecular chaperone DnaJ
MRLCTATWTYIHVCTRNHLCGFCSLAADQVKISLDFMEAVQGCQKTIPIERMKSCESCKGSGAQQGTKPTRCTKCKGSGSITMASGPYVLSTTCPKCAGMGQSVTSCKSCAGSGTEKEKTKITINIPAGTANGQSLRLSGQGNASGESGQPAGHLWCARGS